MSFHRKPDANTQNEAISRFKKTGGQAPKGAKLLGRLTRADSSGGYDLLESEDPRALAEFALMWSDLMELNITPVVGDAQLRTEIR